MQTRQQHTENPYISPTVPCRVAGELRYNSQHEHFEAICDARRMLYRRVRLTGSLEGTVEWDARSVVEIIRVGNKSVAQTFPFWYTPQFDFVIDAESMCLPATIEVRLSRLLPIFVRRFRLVIDGSTVYQEGDWSAQETFADASHDRGPARRPK